MARQIYVVYAHIVDANGAYHTLDGYPKTFDSNNYQGDEEKARRRAEGEMADAWSAMCKRDDRQVQTVFMAPVNGFQFDVKSYGALAQQEQQSE